MNKKLFSDLCIDAVGHILVLFPIYPQAINFVQWTQKTGLDSTYFYNRLIEFIKNVWTEEYRPARISERFIILQQIAPKAGLSLSWILQTSKMAVQREPWVCHDISYFYDKEYAVSSLASLGTRDDFIDNVIVRMPQYVNDFTRDEMETFFEGWGSTITSEQRIALRKWFTLFTAQQSETM